MDKNTPLNPPLVRRLLQFVIPERFYRESMPKRYRFLLKTCRNDSFLGNFMKLQQFFRRGIFTLPFYNPAWMIFNKLRLSIFAVLLGFILPLSGSTPHHEVYFQQYVNYKIDVRLDINLSRLDVKEILLYTNHSPDTLKELYFHLYINKYRKRSLANPRLVVDRGAVRIFTITENDSSNNNYSVDETIMQLKLQSPLNPGCSVRLKFDFSVMIPPSEDRYGYRGYHYDIGNWYITPVVFDRAGWHLEQHLDNEFYQEWGDYNVNITVPKGYVLGATGTLLNPELAYRDTLTENRARFFLFPDDTSLTIWKFEARNVHDFAWVADPYYYLLQSKWNGITLNVLVFDYNKEDWKEVTAWGLKGLQYYCEKFGRYPYNQLTVADTYIKSGGMEYPQLVMINDFINPKFEPGRFRALVLHEMAHNWFYGLLASNQTKIGWMDEGFTTFAEISAMENIFGRYGNYNLGNRGWFANTFGYKNDDRLDNMYAYLQLAKFDLDEDQININSTYLRDFGDILEYSKTACILFMLEYVMGDSLFDTAMKNYFEKWHYHHPYPYDFILVMEETARRDLDWFFEQWLNTNWKLDYAVEGYEGKWENFTSQDSKVKSEKFYYCRIYFQRKEKIFMPVDFDVTLTSGEVLKYHIPVDDCPKPDRDRYNLPYWHFSKIRYTADLLLPAEVKKIQIDPSLRLLDINRLNNVSGFFPPQEFHFMHYQSMAPPLDKYIWEIWPRLFYNDIDKIKLGINVKGSYLNIDHKLDLGVWYKTAWGRIDYDLHYLHPNRWFGNLSWLDSRLYTMDGRQGGKIGFIHRISELGSNKISVEMGITNNRMFNYHYPASPWSKGDVNLVYFKRVYREEYEKEGELKQFMQIDFSTAVFGSDYDFTQFFIDYSRNQAIIYPHWMLYFRIFTGYGEGDIPLQYKFNLSGENGWGEFNDPFYMSKGTLYYPWKREGHLYKYGGGNVRGYSLVTEPLSLFADKIIAFNLDIKMPNPLERLFIPFIEDITPYLFFDTGSIWDKNSWKSIKFKQSCGFSLSWRSFSWLEYIINLNNITFDFPLWLSETAENKEKLDFRWLVRFDFQ
jgi:hypothetical protein